MSDSDERAKVVRFERRLAHRPEKVWRALTEARELAGWFPAKVEGPIEPGARLHFSFDGAEPDVDGVVTECDPPRALAFTMGGEALRFEIVESEGGSLLRLTSELVGAPPANDATPRASLGCAA